MKPNDFVQIIRQCGDHEFHIRTADHQLYRICICKDLEISGKQWVAIVEDLTTLKADQIASAWTHSGFVRSVAKDARGALSKALAAIKEQVQGRIDHLGRMKCFVPYVRYDSIGRISWTDREAVLGAAEAAGYPPEFRMVESLEFYFASVNYYIERGGLYFQNAGPFGPHWIPIAAGPTVLQNSKEGGDSLLPADKNLDGGKPAGWPPEIPWPPPKVKPSWWPKAEEWPPKEERPRWWPKDWPWPVPDDWSPPGMTLPWWPPTVWPPPSGPSLGPVTPEGPPPWWPPRNTNPQPHTAYYWYGCYKYLSTEEADEMISRLNKAAAIFAGGASTASLAAEAAAAIASLGVTSAMAWWWSQELTDILAKARANCPSGKSPGIKICMHGYFYKTAEPWCYPDYTLVD